MLSALVSPLTGSVTKPTKETLKEIRRARWSYINDILSLSLTDNNSKPFWLYIRCQQQDNLRVAALKENGRLFSGGTKKVDILSRQFAPVFTRDSGGTQARLYGPNYPAIKPLTIDQYGVEKLLQGLNVGIRQGQITYPVAWWESLPMNWPPYWPAFISRVQQRALSRLYGPKRLYVCGLSLQEGRQMYAGELPSCFLHWRIMQNSWTYNL